MADTAVAVPIVAFKKRGAKANTRKRAATPPPDSDSDSGFETSEDEQGRQIKRRKRNVGVVASSTENSTHTRKDAAAENTTSTTSAIQIQSNVDNATKTSNWYDEEGEGVRKPTKKLANGSNAIDGSENGNGTYRGTANYQSFIHKNPDHQSSKQVGPQKSSSNVRTITVTDFAPDVCKDYKQTGFCGFGDSCKFLHAREDYAQGWQLDRDWEINSKGKKLTGRTVANADRSSKTNGGDDDDETDESLLEKIPFACIICKKPYSSPIVTKCGHYFCEACALKRYRKDPSCAACGSSTGGVFNAAKKLNRLLDRKRERQRVKREKAVENGEEPPPEEDGE